PRSSPALRDDRRASLNWIGRTLRMTAPHPTEPVPMSLARSAVGRLEPPDGVRPDDRIRRSAEAPLRGRLLPVLPRKATSRIGRVGPQPDFRSQAGPCL